MPDLIDQTAIHVRMAAGIPHALKEADSSPNGRRYWTRCGLLLYAADGSVLTTRDVECSDCRRLAGRRLP